MRFVIPVFKGTMPKVAGRLLPDGYGQNALNARLLDGNLRAWRRPKLVATLAGHGDIEPSLTLFKMVMKNALADVFLRWPTDVSVARGPVAGDATERTYYTGALDNPTDENSPKRPKVTNFQMAVQDTPLVGLDAGEYPHNWLVLGVPAPSTAPLVTNVPLQDTPVVFSDGTSLAMWVTDAGVPVANDATMGGSCIKLPNGAQVHGNVNRGDADRDSITAKVHIGAAGAAIQIRFSCDAAGLGAVVKFTASAQDDTSNSEACAGSYSVGTVSTWAGAPVYTQSGTIKATGYIDWDLLPEPDRKYLSNFKHGVNYDLNIAVKEVGTGTGVFEATIAIGGFTVTIEFSPKGDYLAFKGDGGIVFFDTVTTGGFIEAPDERTTAYVYTWINELGEEGAPSSPSVNVAISSGITTTVSGINDPSPVQEVDHGLVGPTPLNGTNGFKRVYRAVTGSEDTVFRKVIDLPYLTTSFVDKIADESLGVDLETTGWDMPPADGHSIMALPNGITLMASGNEVCPSVRNRPHAYPQDYRLPTDYPIVGLGALNTMAFALTQARPYVVIGSDPSAMSMSKIEGDNFGCVSRRSIASLSGFGVVYACPDGLAALRGAGAPLLLTAGYFTREQWQALKPESIHGVAHDDRYMFWWQDDHGAYGGFIFDPKQGGMGLVPLSLDAITGEVPANPSAMFADPLTDTLYLARTVGGGVSDSTVDRWDPAEDTEQPALPFVWRSKVLITSHPVSFGAAQVRGQEITGDEETVTLEFRYYVDGELQMMKQNPGETEFVLPAVEGTRFEIELASIDNFAFPVVETVQIAEGMDELT